MNALRARNRTLRLSPQCLYSRYAEIRPKQIVFPIADVCDRSKIISFAVSLDLFPHQQIYHASVRETT